MRRSFLLALCGLVLAACDTGTDGPTGLDPDDLIGTWTVDRSESSVFVTVDEAQDIPDLSLPAQSALTLSGAVEGSLSTVQTFSYRGADGVSLTAADMTNTPGVILEMLLDPSAGAFFDLSLPSIPPGFNQYQGQFSDLAPFSYDRLGVSIDAITLDENRAPPGQVVVDGRLSFATRRAVPGGEVEIRGPHAGTGRARLVEDARSIEFAADGALMVNYFAEVNRRTGRWEIAGDSLHLVLDESPFEPADRTTFRVFTPAGRLLFARTDRSGGSAASENRYLVELGTLAGVRREHSVDLSR